MNPFARKAYNELNQSLYRLATLHKRREPLKTFSNTFSYVWNISNVYFPRLAHLDLYSEAYTPFRTKYNAYIVLGLIGGFVVYEGSRLAKARKAIRQRQLDLKF